MSKLPPETQTLYAELLERLLAIEARRTIGHTPGTFTTKTVKGETYYYFQYSEPGGAGAVALGRGTARRFEGRVRGAVAMTPHD